MSGYIRLEIEETPLSDATDKNVIGATTDLTLRTLSFTPSDANTIYVDGLNGNDGNPGTNASPKKTLASAITACDASNFNKIHIKEDSTTYELDTESIPVPSAIGGTRLTMQSALGEKPQVYLKNISASKFSDTPHSNPYISWLQVDGYGSFLINVCSNDTAKKWNGTTNATLQTTATHAFIHAKSYNVISLISGFIPSETQRHLMFLVSLTPNSSPNTMRVYVYDGSTVTTCGDIVSTDVVGNTFSGGSGSGVIAFAPQYYSNVSGTIDCTFFAIQETNVLGVYTRKLHFQNAASYVSGGNLPSVDHIINPFSLEHFNNKVYIAHSQGISTIEAKLLASVQSNYILQPVDCENATCVWADITNNLLYAGNNVGKVFEYNPNTDKWTLMNTFENYVIYGIERQSIDGIFDVMFLRTSIGLIRYDMQTGDWKLMDSTFPRTVSYWDMGTNNTLSGFYITKSLDCYKKYETMNLPQPCEFNGLDFTPLPSYPHSGFRVTHNTNNDRNNFLWCDINTSTNKVYWYCASNLVGLDLKNCKLSNSKYGVWLLSQTGGYNISATPTILLYAKDNNMWNIDEGGIVGNYYGIYYDDATGSPDSSHDFGIRHNNFYNVKDAIVWANNSGAHSLMVSENNFLMIAGYCVRSITDKAYVKNNTAYLSDNYFENCTEYGSYPLIYYHPLFESVRVAEENFRLLSILTGALFQSPSILTPIDTDNTYAYIVAGSGGVGTTTYAVYDLTDKDLWQCYYIFATGTGVLHLEGCDEPTFASPTDIFIRNYIFPISVSGTITVNCVFKYCRVKVVEVGAGFTGLNVNFTFRDIGAHDVERVEYAGYASAPSFRICYNPGTLVYKVSKSNEELTYNYLGEANLLARPRQLATIKFEWSDNAHQNAEDVYNLLILPSLNMYLIKLSFEYMDNATGTGNYVRFAPRQYGQARVFFASQDYDIVQTRPTIAEIGKAWKINQWKGWWVHLVDSAPTDYGYYKILYNTANRIWLDDPTNSLPSGSSSGWTYTIEYFRGLLRTTEFETSKQFAKFEHDDKFISLRYKELEFIEK